MAKQDGGQAQQSPDGRDVQGRRVKHEATIKRSIADAIVTKDEDVFMITQPSGDVPVDGGEHGLGLYHHDCRYLSGYALLLCGANPTALDADASRGFAASFALTNPQLSLEGGGTLAPQQITVTRERVVVSSRSAVHEVLTFESSADHPVTITVALVLRSEFEDMFTVRGVSAPQPSSRRRTFEAEATAMSFSRAGVDGTTRRLDAVFSPAPADVRGTTATWKLTLAPRAPQRLTVALRLTEAPTGEARARDDAPPDLDAVHAELHRSIDAWLGERTKVRSAGHRLDAALRRSLRDLRMLRNDLDGLEFFSGGIPWYAALFGRDSMIAALATLAFEPGIAAQTLRLLARMQGTKVDDRCDEEPGKILHEYRVGELARSGKVPFHPYYGSVDSTLLFLIVIAEHAAWTGRLDLFNELESNVSRALDWTFRNLDDGGWVTYDAKSSHGLDNQGWKDSGDAIVNADGTLAKPPIALAEVQGYAYLAFTLVAALYTRAGRPDRARALTDRAADLRARFNRAFWLEDKGIFALALQAGDEPCAVVASNAGQALWSGIADPDKAQRTADRLLQPDMWSGWGVRTLSGDERRFNPVGYHLGTVWPHDNALIAGGLRRYGHDEGAARIFGGILDLATHFASHRLPELICGFGRDAFKRPVRYPVACHPQAWAAGSVPLLVQTMLGLAPDAFAKRLRVVRPVVPADLLPLHVEDLRVGDAKVGLRFDARPGGAIGVEVVHREGDLDVSVEPEGTF